jgi:exonuclease SbcC
MSDFKLKEITIENFKVFKDFPLDFESADLVVFGGPNGYGKTTIFDAIELALTGTIARFKPIESGNTGCKDVLVANDQSKPVIIELKITRNRGKEQLKIIRELKPGYEQTPMYKKDKKTKNFKKLWELSLKKQGEQKVKEISQEELEDELGQKNFQKYYNLFYYVQQEDTSHFLKNSEKERLEEISRLFGTEKEEKEQQNLSDAKNEIRRYKTKLINKKNELERIISSGKIELTKEEFSYDCLLPWTKKIKEWDREELFFTTPETKNKYLTELNKIQTLVMYRDHFLVQKDFKDNYRKKETIKALLVGAKFLGEIGKIKDRHNTRKKLDANLNVLKKRDFLTESTKLDRKFLEGAFPDFDFKIFFGTIQELKKQKSNLNSTREIIRELLDFRSDFLSKFNQIDSASIEKKECPLCGFDWNNRETLFHEIEKKTDFFKSLLSSEEKTFHDKKTEFESRLLESLKDQVKNKANSAEFLISDSFFEELLEAQKKKEDLSRLEEWLIEKKIEYSDLLIERTDEDIDTDVLKGYITDLVQRIKQKAPPLPGQYVTEDGELKFAEVYRDYFDGVPENLKEMEPESIEKKKGYIERQYFQSLEKKKVELKNLEGKLSRLIEVEQKLTDAINIYNKQIRTHHKRIIRDIEIPFFIYSGKILQSIGRKNTIGIFIKDPSPREEELENIRFVTHWDTDHDVINTTSSGQLAGIVIALTLAMNKIYSKGLESLFIDDPVQTMDDINMISLVELLRNDFEDKQLFLSTHESDKEKYFLYKYQKYGRSVKRINCMTENVPRESKDVHSKA